MYFLHIRCAIHLKNDISEGTKFIAVHEVNCALFSYMKFVIYKPTTKFPNVSTFAKFYKKYNFIGSAYLFTQFDFPISDDS
jgi:hypothetical protein